ncbi:MAG: RagB/SusD family nutrient uptake outer membrane protein [Candidatus Pseudobacter hemicellulosilyticus]|uniref:RagB/SusD family nutrient uptake outer membrane protein n=1 Tax=Candidatus Pseudobacter hemicellulosilyticus TaxID=3121375 RepID=A0AAJ5WU34_9BACT|nr:MAG: RagB/SusD family nutrient uptake outer membrane protein [Pseudobacter sp.]
MRLLLLIICCGGLSMGCRRSGFLSEKPDQRLAEPNTIEQFQAILDNDYIMNGSVGRSRGVDPCLLIAGSDDSWFPSDILEAATIHDPYFRYLYSFNDQLAATGADANWNVVYQAVFYANVVLDGIEKIERTAANQAAHDQVKGSALFYRARYFYQLAQVYGQPYVPATAGADLGIVLRLEPDINESIQRSTVIQTYHRILADARAAIPLLPLQSASPYKTRPCRPAGYALLAKTCLLLQDYEGARNYADSCLRLQSSLMDFSTLDGSLPYPIPRTNPETIFHSMTLGNPAFTISMSMARIDSNLYSSYAPGDLRRELFFTKGPAGEPYFRGSYDGSDWYFSGIAVDEVLLIRAEANARTQQLSAAMDDLNRLLEKRWKKDGSFQPLTAGTAGEALALVLQERRKELVQRGTRWTDLRRLNAGGAGIRIERWLAGRQYLLLPGDPRFTYLLPAEVMAFHPELPQTPR